ncbi:MAG: TetR family transcriptional regulator [Bacillota bacterium]|nr:TetR family transcriptional regulator [Bacillota bacterium]
MSFKRARSDQHVQERIQEIISAAAEIYDSVGYEGLSFSSISELTKFTRPTIYKYFNTKEEILLKILLSDMQEWILSLVNSFKINKLYSINEITDIWVNAISGNFRLLKLFSMLFTSIETNASLEVLVEFKKGFFKLQEQAMELMAQLFPNAEKSDIYRFLVNQLALALGLYPMCHLTDIQRKAYEISGITNMTPDFKDIYRANIYQLLYCLEQGIHIPD